MTPEQRKKLTKELAEAVRAQLLAIKVEANVRCHYYRNSLCMVLVYPKSAEYYKLNYWEQQCVHQGLEYWLPIWIKNDKSKHRLFDAARIHVG